jgi:hypothetical protein
MEENLPNFFMGYLLEGPLSPSSQGLNISSPQGLRLRSFQVVNLSSPSQPLGLGFGLSVNVSLSALKLGVRLQINKRLWINGKLQMMILICGKKNIRSIERNLWLQRIGRSLPTKSMHHSLMRCHTLGSNVETKSPR